MDGEELKKDPVTVMNSLQKVLEVRTFVDYSKLLRFSQKKGFYCPVSSELILRANPSLNYLLVAVRYFMKPILKIVCMTRCPV